MSNDPFEKAKAIRRGELDSEIPTFDELRGWIQRVPVTWLPALLAQVITCCVVDNVFQPGKLIAFAKRAEEKAADPNSIFRKEETT